MLKYWVWRGEINILIIYDIDQRFIRLGRTAFDTQDSIISYFIWSIKKIAEQTVITTNFRDTDTFTLRTTEQIRKRIVKGGRFISRVSVAAFGIF